MQSARWRGSCGRRGGLIACTPLVVVLLSGVAQTAAQAPASAPDDSAWTAGRVIVNPAVRFDRSAALPQLYAAYQIPPRPDRRRSTTAPVAEPATAPPKVEIGPEGAAVEQVSQEASRLPSKWPASTGWA